MSEELSVPAAAHARATLGDVLYASPTVSAPSEDEWSSLVRRVAANEIEALHRLYERTGHLVHTLALRIAGTESRAEEVTTQVFEDIWRRAWSFSSSESTALAWIMNQARSRARELATLQSGGKVPPCVGRGPDPAPPASLQARIARRIAELTQSDPVPVPSPKWTEPEWAQVAPAIECKLLAVDSERERVSMLVRLEPGGSYPPHTHAGLEELHLLEGELWIEDRKLRPGDYNRAMAPTGDTIVRSDTGCTCVLITSTRDELL